MQHRGSSVKPGDLKRFFPFSEMPPEYVIIASSFAELATFADGEAVLEPNSEDPNDYFLLRGKLVVTDIYDSESVLESDSPESEQPLPQLRPSAYRIVASGAAKLIEIPQEVIKRVRSEAPERDPALDEEAELDITQSREFFNDFKEELTMNRVRLPSLAATASRVHKMVFKQQVSPAELAVAASLDPSVTAKLLKMANSSLYNSQKKVRDLDGIVSRLGVFSTREITACFAFRDVYQSALPALVKKLEEQITQSRQVSVMAAAIAELGGVVDPGQARLAGLLHNVGVLPIFSYSMRNVAYAVNADLLERAIQKISVETGVLLAKKWRFSEDLIRSIEHAHDWHNVTGSGPDLVNVVLTANYHYQMSTRGLRALPKPRDVPSIAAATSSSFDENVSLKILGRAKELLQAQAA